MIFDRFILMGQSQPIGRGTGHSYLPDTNNVGYIYPSTGNGITELLHSRSYLANNNAWRAFARKWFALTGRGSFFINTAVGGAGLLKAANGGNYWDVSESGNLFEAGKLIVAAAMVIAGKSNRLSNTGATYVLNSQGETDGNVYNGTTVSATTYQAALEALMVAAVSYYGADLFCESQTGIDTSDPTNAGWASIRSAQVAAVAAQSSAMMMWDKANDSGALVLDGNREWVSGWDNLGDFVHYVPEGYEAWGIGGAINLFAAI